MTVKLNRPNLKTKKKYFVQQERTNDHMLKVLVN